MKTYKLGDTKMVMENKDTSKVFRSKENWIIGKQNMFWMPYLVLISQHPKTLNIPTNTKVIKKD